MLFSFRLYPLYNLHFYNHFVIIPKHLILCFCFNFSLKKHNRIRWYSFQKSHRPSFSSKSTQICTLSVRQIHKLQSVCMLTITTLMEKFSPANRSGWNWTVSRFIKKVKEPDYKDKKVFGVPLIETLRRSGQPVPQCILYAMKYLRSTAKDADGIFRKSGVKSRIQNIRDQIELNTGNNLFFFIFQELFSLLLLLDPRWNLIKEAYDHKYSNPEHPIFYLNTVERDHIISIFLLDSKLERSRDLLGDMTTSYFKKIKWPQSVVIDLKQKQIEYVSMTDLVVLRMHNFFF